MIYFYTIKRTFYCATAIEAALAIKVPVQSNEANYKCTVGLTNQSNLLTIFSIRDN